MALTFEETGAAPTPVGSLYGGLGIVFGPNAIIQRTSDPITNCSQPGQGNFYNDAAPSCGAFILSYSGDSDSGKSTIISIAKGFEDSFALIYAPVADLPPASVSIFDASHQLLGSQTLIGQGACETEGWLCKWGSVDISFLGTAYSVEITGPTDAIYFDNVLFGDVLGDGGGSNVPEPKSMALSLAALGALAWSRKRKPR
ncbi:MAG: PEP-CTERM sorting domain-containing protein [Burkholderiaceae bacterium]